MGGQQTPGSKSAANETRVAGVSIVIPVFNQIAFTRQCLDRIRRHTGNTVPFEVIVVDNGSTDGTRAFFVDRLSEPRLRYHRNDENLGFARGNNLGASLSSEDYLLFLNNDTLVRPGWLEQMMRLAESNSRIGVVGIKQLFPYTNTIHHTGIVFTPGGVPQHIYPHLPADLAHVNKQREYQAVNGACLLIRRSLFEACGRFDEGYVNGYEDVDLCLAVRQRGLSVWCCTRASIYHYGQMTETRTADDDRNAARFKAKWGAQIRVDHGDYMRQDGADASRSARSGAGRSRTALPDRTIYFADDLSSGSALSWATVELALALKRHGAPVHVRQGLVTDTVPAESRRALRSMMVRHPPSGGTQIKWSHYWPKHLSLELDGRINFELFVINYLFDRPQSEPWDYWLQCLAQNHYHKLPLSHFCRDALLQIGVSPEECHVLNLGYSREIDAPSPTRSRGSTFRFLVVTNSHDLERYGTRLLLDAYWEAFRPGDPVVLVVKDYGASSGDTSLQELLARPTGRARVEYVPQFTTKAKLIQLYRSCDAFVSPHRGEGFGMKILDAMACGLPVIAPLFGGSADYCTAENSLPIDFELTPMGDCLDSRSLHVTNGPIWSEPSRSSLVRQLRAAFDDPAAARAIGERGRRDVAGRMTWDNAARRLIDITSSVCDRLPSAVGASPATSAASPRRSPHWRGVRISVIIPTYNRKAQLLTALHAFESQSILSSEFEIVVVDDGSTDGTREAVQGRDYPFELRYVQQTNQGPAAARNVGLREAVGELVLFIGDDIIAIPTLLEEHLIAHATHHAESAAILGHVDWPPATQPNAVMRYVVGDGTLQSAYQYIPALPTLDFRFFYTTNISLKRAFLVAGADDGIRFDPCFRYAAFEDSEFALRLTRRGLTIHYWKDALAHHDHWMDLESFSRREYHAGQMAVVFYRKHPGLDDLLHVRWIGDSVASVAKLVAQPSLLGKVRAIDQATDRFLHGLERSLDELVQLDESMASGAAAGLSPSGLRGALNGVLAVIFDVHRTRGKVEEWYRGVPNRDLVDAAQAMAACVRKLTFFTSRATELQGLGVPGLSPEVLSGFHARVDELDRDLGGELRARLSRPFTGLVAGGAFGRRAIGWMRAMDVFVQTRLSDLDEGRWLTRYQRLREDLKRLVRQFA